MHEILRSLLALHIFATFAGCTSERGIPTTWDNLDVGKLQLELEDNAHYELLTFHPGGTVSATLGQRNGAITAPLLYWHVESNRLVFTELPKGGTVHNVLEEPRIEGHRLFVTVPGYSKRTYVIRRGAA